MSISRRGFVGGLATAVAAVWIGTVGVPLTAKGITLLEAAPGSGSDFDAGDVTKIAEGFTDTFVRDYFALIVRKGDRIYVMSALCPHQGRTIRVMGEQLRCPGHGSRFDQEGNTTRGPATGQLNRHGVQLKDGKLLVDTAKIFLPGEFEKEGAFVTVPAAK